VTRVLAGMFNPQAFPDGKIMWDLSTSVDREHEYLETFEQYRRTYLVIGIADYLEDNDPEVLHKQLLELKALVRAPWEEVEEMFHGY
jgi:hypothetical protein